MDQQTRVVLGVPIYNSDNKIIGILGGSCNVTLLSHMLFDDLFYGEGDTLVVKQDGTIIAQEEGDSQQKREISYGGNLLNYYEEKNINQTQTLNMLKSDFKEGKVQCSGCFLSITGNKRNRITFIDQRDRLFHRGQTNSKFLSQFFCNVHFIPHTFYNSYSSKTLSIYS